LSVPDFAAWGWRIPFIASAALVGLGLYVRISLAETEAFARALERAPPLPVPLASAFAGYWREILQGAFAMAVCYVLFYTSTVFALGYGVNKLAIPRQTFLELLCGAVLFMAAATPISAVLADRFGRRPVLICGALAAALSGFAMAPLLGGGTLWGVAGFLALELFLMGVTFAPMAALLPELFPTRVRYTGASIAYNLGGILGGSLAPYIAQRLADSGGLTAVGLYVSGTACLSLFAVFAMGESRGRDLQSA
jgi:MFS family permease